MSEHPDHFIPETVDEQIEHLTHDSPGQQETAKQELVHHLRRLYQAQMVEKDAGSLDHAWERITHTKAYLTQYANTQAEQQGKQERRIRTMKTLPDPITDMPYDDQDMTTPPTRIRRISRFLQSLAAVLLVGVLIGGFFILFRSQHTTAGSSQTHSIIVASTTDGTIYAVQPDSGITLWQHAIGQANQQGGESNITTQGKVVYAVEGNQVYALNALNGTLLWKKTLDALDASVGNGRMLQVDSSVVYISGYAAGIGGGGGHIYALQANNGTLLWQHQASLLTVANGIVYTYVMDTHGNEVMKTFSGKNGQLLWQYATYAITGVVAHDAIYIISAHQPTPGNNGGNKQYKSLLALNARTGKLLWSKSVIGADYLNPPVIVKNMVIVGSFPNLNSYRDCAYHTNDGSQMWCSESTMDSANGNATKYIAASDALYTIKFAITSASTPLTSCQLEARNISNGSLRWSHPCAQIQSPGFSIVGLNGTVFIAGGGNAVISVLDSHGNIQKTFQLSNTDSIVSLTAGS